MHLPQIILARPTNHELSSLMRQLYSFHMSHSNIESEVRFGTYVTASQGCEHAQPTLEDLVGSMSNEDALTVLEINDGDCLAGTSSPFADLPHLLFNSADEFNMRKTAVFSNIGTHTLIIEDHMEIADDFLPTLRDFLSSYKEIPALGFYAVNGTPNNYGSRILFRWVFGLASLDLWPRSPEPVCSAFVVNNHFLATYADGLDREIKVGEIESHLIPYLIPRVNGLLPRELHVIHSQRVSIFQAAQGVFENARISGHQERGTALVRWVIILIQRHYHRFIKILRVGRPSFIESLGVFFLANVGLVGGFLGRFGSIRNSYRRLARTHTLLPK